MNIRYIIKGLFAVALCLSLNSCSDDEEAPKDKIPASEQGTYTDPRDGNEYKWVRYGKQDWMAENFRYYLNDDSKCKLYKNSNGKLVDVKKYGRLYTFNAALEVCPEGWRLPTDEDWKELEMTLGMSKSDADKWDERGNIASRMLTRYNETCDLNLLLGGYHDPGLAMGLSGFIRLGIYGFYWTASKDTEQGKGDGYYWYRRFVFNQDYVIRQSTSSEMLFSVRYVRDAQ